MASSGGGGYVPLRPPLGSGTGEADQRLCFRYMYKDSTIPLLSKSEISSL